MTKKLFYKIGEACKLLDIQPYVLRYWETEFPFLSPGKSKSGQRVYSPKEIEIIRRIKGLLYEEGYTIAGAKKRLESDLPGILQSESIDDLDLDEEAFAARLRSGGGEAGATAGSAAGAAAGAAEENPAAAVVALAAPAVKSAATAPKAASGKGAAAKSPVVAPVVPAAVDDAAATSPKTALDTGAAMTIKTLRAGIVHALEEAKQILARLETPAGQSKASPAARR